MQRLWRKKKADKTQLYVLHNAERRVRQWTVELKQDTGNARAEKLHMRRYGLGEERGKWIGFTSKINDFRTSTDV